MWHSPKSKYKCTVLIQHVPTSKFLTIEPHHNHKITLCNQDQITDGSIFHIHQRPSRISTPATKNTKNNNNDNDDENENSKLNWNQQIMIGLQNKCTKLWLGQSSMFGSLICTSRKFGKNEEWEIIEYDYVNVNNTTSTSTTTTMDNKTSSTTRILCASANWGSGGFLNVNVITSKQRQQEQGKAISNGGFNNNGNDECENVVSFAFGGYDLHSKRNATLWSVIILDDNDGLDLR